MKGFFRAALIVLLLAQCPFRASDHTGKVTLTGVSIPGATVTAKQGEKTIATITDQGGVYRFTGLADGTWTVTVKMVGFDTITRDVTLPSSAEGVWELTLMPIEKIVGALPAPRPVQPASTSRATARRPEAGQRESAAATPQTGFQRAGVNQVATAPPPPAAGEEPPPIRQASARCRSADQRQREQRRRISVRAGAGVRLEPAEPAFAVHLRVRGCRWGTRRGMHDPIRSAAPTPRARPTPMRSSRGASRGR